MRGYLDEIQLKIGPLYFSGKPASQSYGPNQAGKQIKI
jgi:hypothetical protein